MCGHVRVTVTSTGQSQEKSKSIGQNWRSVDLHHGFHTAMDLHNALTCLSVHVCRASLLSQVCWCRASSIVLLIQQKDEKQMGINLVPEFAKVLLVHPRSISQAGHSKGSSSPVCKRFCQLMMCLAEPLRHSANML